MNARRVREKRSIDATNDKSTQRIKEKERIYNEGGSFVSQRQTNERLRSNRLSSSQLKDYDLNVTSSQNASTSLDKSKNNQIIGALSPYPPQSQYNPVLKSKTYNYYCKMLINPIGGSIPSSNALSAALKAEKPHPPQARAKSQVRAGRHITPVRKRELIPQREVSINSRTDRSPAHQNPITSVPLASTYRKLERSNLKTSGMHGRSMFESSPDDAEYSQEMNEVLERALQNSISRFNTSLKKNITPTKTSTKDANKKKLTIISAISENQPRNPPREASPVVDESTSEKDLGSRISNSPYGASVELPRIHKQPVRQKMTRNKSEENKGKFVNYGEMFTQVRRTNQEIEGGIKFEFLS